MSERLSWERDGRLWPHREASRFVEVAGLCWHVQRWGPMPVQAPEAPFATRPPVLLLIHGTGASSHSWRDLAPRLAAHFHVVACDLPGHAFTAMPPAWQLSLPGMAQALGALMAELRLAPALVVGHSAGAAIGARMCLDGHIEPAALVSLGGAFLPLGGLAGQLFSPVAKLMAAAPFVPRFFAWRAGDDALVRRLLDGTGSQLDDEGVALYAQLVRNPGHAAGALAMMANWDLVPMMQDLRRLKPTLALVAPTNDLTIPPDQARRVKALLPRATLIELPGLGHLAHEEQPDLVAELVLRVGRDQGLPEGL